MGERFYLQQLEGARNMKKNYTNEQVAQMIKLYGEGNSDAERRAIIEKLAKEMGFKSINYKNTSRFVNVSNFNEVMEIETKNKSTISSKENKNRTKY